jgi:hypothetical protein
MSILTHGLERPLDLAHRPERMSTGRKALFKPIAMRALTVLAMGSVLAALIALKTAVCVWHLHA